MNYFQSERIYFHEYEQNFYEDLYTLFCTNHVVMSSALSGGLISREELNLFIDQKFNHGKTPFGFLTIQERNSGNFIGVTGIFECDYFDQKGIEFGFILDQKSWGKGYATEIGSFWIDYILDHYPDHNILATTRPDNLASKKVLEKLNLIFVKNIDIESRGLRSIYQYHL